MNKKSTLLAAALMAVSSFTANAASDGEVNPEEWTAGNYYYLKVGNNFLSLSGERSDSLYFKTISEDANKAVRDSALWEITKVRTETTGSIIYQFKNKKTKALLSFSPNSTKPVLAEGISEWSVSEDGKIVSYLDADKSIAFSYANEKDFVLSDAKGAKAFTVNYPETKVGLKANELGGNFSVFRLSFGDKFDGDIFSGQDIIAKSVKEETTQSLAESGNTAADWVRLQVKGDETFDDKDATPKYFGLDTTKVEITGATDVFGAKFVLDSTYKHVESHKLLNDNYQQFRFEVDLKNDSLAMFVKNAPIVNGDLENLAEEVQVVYTKVGTTQLLTVSKIDASKPVNGAAPFITVEKGTPAEIGKTGVYFLKSASKTVEGGKYISSFEGGKIKTMTGTPSVNSLEGQWYIKEDNGMYSIVDRKDNTKMLLQGEVFAVQGMANTFTFGGNADSITVEPQKVNLDDKFLGSVNFTKDELANNGYVLNLIPTGTETSKTYTFTADSILQVKSGEAKDAVVFKIVAVDTTKVGGALSLKDTVSIVRYQLKSQFSNKYVAYDKAKASLKVSDYAPALKFKFNTNLDGGTYNMQIDTTDATINNKYVDAQVSSSNMVLSETPAYFNFVEMEAPEYGTFDSGNKRFTSDLKSLTMNPLNFFAEAKQEGQEIVKSTYEKDNFSLWLSKSKASTAEKPLYFIMTSLAVDGDPNASRHYFYMVSGRDSSLVDTSADKNYRVHFIKNDTIETMKDNANNPALFALKVTESGNYLLENQKELNRADGGAPYVGIINNVVVMTKDGVEFSVETAPAPVANEEIEAPTTVKVIGGVGEFSIRNAHGKKITVSNILGQTIATRIVSSDYVTVPTTRGVVIVSVEGDKAYKVIVK